MSFKKLLKGTQFLRMECALVTTFVYPIFILFFTPLLVSQKLLSYSSVIGYVYNYVY